MRWRRRRAAAVAGGPRRRGAAPRGVQREVNRPFKQPMRARARLWARRAHAPPHLSVPPRLGHAVCASPLPSPPQPLPPPLQLGPLAKGAPLTRVRCPGVAPRRRAARDSGRHSPGRGRAGRGAPRVRRALFAAGGGAPAAWHQGCGPAVQGRYWSGGGRAAGANRTDSGQGGRRLGRVARRPSRGARKRGGLGVWGRLSL
jgi:hypothetical protein